MFLHLFGALNWWIRTFQRDLWTYISIWCWWQNSIQLFINVSFIFFLVPDIRHSNYVFLFWKISWHHIVNKQMELWEIIYLLLSVIFYIWKLNWTFENFDFRIILSPGLIPISKSYGNLKFFRTVIYVAKSEKLHLWQRTRYLETNQLVLHN